MEIGTNTWTVTEVNWMIIFSISCVTFFSIPLSPTIPTRCHTALAITENQINNGDVAEKFRIKRPNFFFVTSIDKQTNKQMFGCQNSNVIVRIEIKWAGHGNCCCLTHALPSIHPQRRMEWGWMEGVNGNYAVGDLFRYWFFDWCSHVLLGEDKKSSKILLRRSRCLAQYGNTAICITEAAIWQFDECVDNVATDSMCNKNFETSNVARFIPCKRWQMYNDTNIINTINYVKYTLL